MANTKVTQHVIANNAITADQLATAAVTAGKLHATLDLSNKTLTLPAVAVATTQSASDNTTKVATTAYVTTAIANLNDSAPAALNTLNEIAAALGDDANYASTTTAAIAAKLPLAGGTLTGNLVLSGAPSSGLHPATKTYTDTADALKLNLSGGTLTGDLILNTTTALKIPVGTTGQRPSAATGQIRWNTSDGALEVYNGSAWVAVGTGTSNKVLDTFTGNGSNRTFALTVTPANEDAIMVFIDGAYQEKGDYVLTNASLVLDTAPLANEKIAVHTTTASVHDGTSALNNQFTATANQTAFTLSQDPKSENNTQVYINGVYQQKTDYTVVGTTLTFDTGLTVGDVVEVNMFTVSTLGNTDTVSEGVSNLYHTAARARGAISVTGNAISYNSSTGVLSSNFEEGPTFTGNVNITGDLDVGAADGNNAVMKLSANTGNWVFTNVQSSRKLEISDSDGTGTVLTIDTSGNVGIGETSPDARLDIRSSGASTYPLLIKSSDDQQLFRFREESDTRGTFYINDASENSKVTLASVGSSSFMGGNLGIGTTAPDSKLEVVTNSTSIDYTLRLKNTNTTDDNGTAVLFQGKDTSGNDVSYGALKFKYTNHVTEKSQFELWHMNNSGTPTQALTLDHDGMFGIGTTNPGAPLDIGSASPKIRLTDTGGGYSELRGNGGVMTLTADAGNNVANSAVTFETDGTERMRIDASGNITGTSSGTAMKAPLLQATNGNVATYSGTTPTLHSPASGTLAFSMAGGERMRISSAGDVMVGTTTNLNVLSGSPKIQVGKGDGHSSMQFYSGNSNVGALYFGDGTSGAGAVGTNGRYPGYIEYRHSNDEMAFRAGATTALSLNASRLKAYGNIEVGTFTQSQTNAGEAWIGRAADRQDGTLTVQLGGNAATGTSFEIVDRAWTKVLYHFSGEAPADSLWTGSNGNTQFGYHAYNSTSGISMIGPTGRTFWDTNYNSTGAEILLVNNRTANGAVSLLQYRTNSVVEGSIYGTSTGLAISNVSDYRKKENIRDLTGSLNVIKSLQPRLYEYREGFGTAGDHVGFIAHEIQDHIPKAVSGNKDDLYTQTDIDEGATEITIGSPKYQAVAYTHNEIITRLVQSIQEQQTLIESLTARISTLEG